MNWQVFRAHVFPLVRPLVIRWGAALLLRSEERRGGKEC